MTIRRREVLATPLALAAGTAVAGKPIRPVTRRIATEEAFATRELVDAWLEIARTAPDAHLDYKTGVLFIFEPSAPGSNPERFSRQLLDIDAERLAIMDEAGVAMQLLSVTIPGVQVFAPDRGVALAAATNDVLAEAISRHPTRFRGLACMPPQAPVAAAREMERAVTKLGLNGFIINSHTDERYLDDPFFAPVLEAAEALGLPIYLHPRAPSNGMAGPFRDYSMGGSIWGFGAETGTHAVRLILSGTLDRFPKLKIVLGHMGEALPFWMWRLDHMAQRRARDGRPEQIQLKPSEYFRRNFAVTTSGFESNDVLDLAIKAAGIENVMWAIDYPYESSLDAVAFMDAAPLGERDRAMVYHRNAERLFRLPLA